MSNHYFTSMNSPSYDNNTHDAECKPKESSAALANY